MSALSLLSPIKHALSIGHDPPRKTSGDISLEIHLPTLGAIFMKTPDDPLWPHARSAGPRDDQLLSGVLGIHVPPCSFGGGRRCKSIRVGLRTRVQLDMGPGRGWEEDTIFERKVEMMAGNAEGIVLDPGVQRFEFTLILPSTLAPHDWHPRAKVIQEVFAELEGLPEPQSTATHALSLFGLGQRRAKSSHPSTTRSTDSGNVSRSRVPSPHSPPVSPSLSPMLSAAGSYSIMRQETSTVVPSYERSQAENTTAASEDWIVGQYETVKNVMLMHNPNPAGTSSDLDLRQNGYSPGIGVWDLKVFSDIFSIGAPIHVRFTISSLSHETTIFMWRLVLRQAVSVTSPRDESSTCKPITTSREFTLARGGTSSGVVRSPGAEHPALWRGTVAGGKDEGECVMSGSSNMPRDDVGRPTTLPGLVTPITVSHVLMYEVHFSVWGEDDRGQPMAKPGPGGQRSMRISKPLVVPSCALVPSHLDLPQYETYPTCTDCDALSDDLDPLCLDSAITALPHAIGKLPPLSQPENMGNAGSEGRRRVCTKCAIDQQLPHRITWKLCACGLDAGDIAGRMSKFVNEGMMAEGTGLGEEQRLSQKEVAERGTSSVR